MIGQGVALAATVLGGLIAAGPAAAAADRPTRVLMIVTSHDRMGSTGEKTGIWLDELTTPYQEFVTAGAQITIASPAGGPIPIDPRSESKPPESVKWFMDKAQGARLLSDTIKLAAVKDEYDAYFVVGGHGAMWDLPRSKDLQRLLGQADRSGRVIAAVCHGPAALVNVVGKDGKPLLNGRRVTGFSNSEERAVKLDKVVPFALQSQMEAAGGRYQARPDFQAFAVRDGRLVTGQNPASAVEAARLVLRTASETRQSKLARER
jgi:putative intracellular protease/amidase